jgi:hypothetical protein
MSHTDDEGAVPAVPDGDRSEAALDAAFSAANAGMVAAIRRGFDLDAGLARIIGAPPPVGFRSAGSPAEPGWQRLPSFAPRPDSGPPWLDPYICSVDVGTQIARLRFRILDLGGQGQVGGSATVLLGAAADNLQNLHRGLEGKSLSRHAAGSLLDAAGLALETASDMEACEIACPDKDARGEDPEFFTRTSARDPLLAEKRIFRKRPSWLAGAALVVLGAALALTLSPFGVSGAHGVLAALGGTRHDAAEAAVIAVSLAILGLLTFRGSCWLFRLFRRRSERIFAVTEAIKARAALRRQAADVSRATAVLRRSLPPGDREPSEVRTYVTLLHAVAKLQRPPAHAATSRIDVLREELDYVRPNVMKLFAGAGDCSPCASR